MIQDRAIVNIEYEEETVGAYPSFRMVPVSVILSDLLPRFQGQDIVQRQITRKWYS